MPLRPEDTPQYWQYLLTDPLYLLPQDLQAPPAPQAGEPAAAPPQAAAAAQPAGAGAQAVTPAAGSTEAPKPDLLWGSLQRGVLILVDYPNHPLMDRPDGLFLVDILKAIGYEFKEVATLNISRCTSAADWAWVRQQHWQKLISFGVQHPELPLTQAAGLYELKREQGRPIVLVEPLPLIRSDVGRKKKVWNLLKEAFV
ncbi:hypothetical protein [Cesiribacter andamanensis]|uniref:Uncharacterized protein n=1 Tax=Cesiribacter andamanensis AMV16 TaxID=1279009 RepID=M7N2F4_9BACT|nr:hypothetical protein [Cesiribacter andamanensis]EMR01391.1 hypothetical protein ADICEAN_03479 [Cesiribacter andamanensis AMV16]